MPSTSLGDHRTQTRPPPAAPVDVVLTIDTPRPMQQPSTYGRVCSVFVCVLLLAAGVTVGIWATV